MAIRVGINGFGRIGRTVFRILRQRGIDVVGINDITDSVTLAHLLRYDTVMGRYSEPVATTEDGLKVGDSDIPIKAIRNPEEIPWSDLGADYVIESTGVFRRRADLEKHLAAGAQKVILTVPPKDELDALVVLGVNDEILKPEDKLVSNAWCRSNGRAPLVKAIHENFGLESGVMTTVHAYTNDQRLADLPHSDLRRARAAAQNIIPTTTGAARAVGKVLPDLNGKLDGMALRVPVINGSVVDLVATLGQEVTSEEVNAAVKAAADKTPTILEYCEDPIVSSDVIGNPHSSIFDALSTMVLGGKGRTVKVIAWYDNEWGYSSRVCDLLEKIAG